MDQELTLAAASSANDCLERKFPIKHWRATQERVEKFISGDFFTDSNLRGRLYSEIAPLLSLKYCKAEQRWSFQQAVAALRSAPTVSPGVSIGPTWSTHWFQCDIQIPHNWKGKHIVLRWNSGGEAMVWMDGEPMQGLSGNEQKRTTFNVTKQAQGGDCYTVYIEAVVSGMFGAGNNGLINPPQTDRTMTVSQADIAVFDDGVYELLMDLTVLIEQAKHLPRDFPGAYKALYTANQIVNLCDPFNHSTFSRCRDLASEFFSQNSQHGHTVHAISNCHIDTAWLWPYSETIRKCARSWSSVLGLMEDHPNMTFACSQAQQLEWVKQHYPGLYARIKLSIQQGRFLPVGGTWVEMDGNIPSGESFVRQFLIGQQFFKKEFGTYCSVFWLPDTFGYSAQLPQIMSLSGIKYFLSQKMSWNLVNRFPHNTFLWAGLDGTKCIAHFPPADTYGSDGSVEDVLKSVKQFKDKGRSSQSILLYGYGDGGGGPTDTMVQSLKRMETMEHNVEVVMSTPYDFFQSVEQRDLTKLCTWVGELYLELHQGTYTTQALLKKENRQLEFLLHDTEFVSTLAIAMLGHWSEADKLKSDLLLLWKKLLLNQFHDVIPGSCIDLVVKDALKLYQEIRESAEKIISSKCEHLTKALTDTTDVSSVEDYGAVNTFSWSRTELVVLPPNDSVGPPAEKKRKDLSSGLIQQNSDGKTLGLVKCPPAGLHQVLLQPPLEPATVLQQTDGSYLLENQYIKAVVANDGALMSVIHKSSGKETIASNCRGNQLTLFDDVPLFWDAWDVMDYHLETRKAVSIIQAPITVVEKGPLRVALKLVLKISEKSHAEQTILLAADIPYIQFQLKVEWKESHKFLKVEFPLAVHSTFATYEIQFGHVMRPTHFNTSWDQAKYEVCGHKWADLSEHGFGVALLNDCKYGYSTLGNVMRLSLLRSPKAPDANADMGEHVLSYALMPHSGTFQEAEVIQNASNFNNPMRILSTSVSAGGSLFEILGSKAVILDTLKLSESAEYCIVARLFEAFGSHAKVGLVFNSALPIVKYQRVDLLENPISEHQNVSAGEEIPIHFSPFQVVTLLLYCDS